MVDAPAASGPGGVLVVNASPLIHLAEAGRLDLLRDAGARVWVPEPVAREIRTYGVDDPTARALAEMAWLVVWPTPAVSEDILTWDLGPGESSVLALARANADSVAVIDDLPARRCAQALGIALRGTVGLVLLAKRAGRIPSARQVIETLRERGMFLSDSVIERALSLVGEG